MEGFFRSFNKSTDELLLSATQKDVDNYFDKEKSFLLDYHTAIKVSTANSDKMTSSHKSRTSIIINLTVFYINVILGVADSFIQVSSGLCQIGAIEGPKLERFILKLVDCFEKVRVCI